MNHTTTTTTGARWRLATIALTAILATLPTLLATPASAAPDRQWSGYQIDGPGRAVGTWIGGYRLADGAKTYRLNPAAKAPTGRLAPVVKTTSLPGTPTRAASRAAFILSKYGANTAAARSAAVDAAVLHLTAGGRWTLTGKAGKVRINQAARSTKVRSYARAMLQESARLAGPYTVKISTVDAVRPAGFKVTVSVRSAAGVPIVGAPVRAIVNGAGNVLTRTGPGGVATATWSKTNGVRLGQHRVRVEVRQLHESRLILRKPRTGTTLALGGWRQALILHDQMIVKAQPKAAVAPTGTIRTRKTYQARVTVTGSVRNHSRKASVRLHGPFKTKTAAKCRAHTARTFKRSTTANGSWNANSFQVSKKG